MNKKEAIPEDSFSSDEEFDDEGGSESSSDVDAKLAEDDVFDVEFFKCYSALKKKDDKIYDKNVKFFNEDPTSSSESDNEVEVGKKDGDDPAKPSAKTSKHAGPKMTLLDHQLNLNDDELEDLDNKPKIDLNTHVSKSFYQKELDEIKKSIEKVSENIDSESDDDLLVVKGDKGEPSKPRPKKKIDSILDKIEDQDDEDVRHLRQVWSNLDSLTKEEKFLRDYILNKRYLPPKTDETDEDDGGFFSKNIEDLSDVDSDHSHTDETKKEAKVEHRSDEKDFDKITRIPRNSTKTIRDLVEKREKREKRLKKLEKEKKRKEKLKNADFEDIVGDLPTKFHYRETEPNDYGLSAEELLMATDEELEQWVKLKDAVAYKSPEQEIAEKRRFEERRNDLEMKKKIFKSIYGDSEVGEADEAEEPTDVSKRKRKRTRNSNSGGDEPSQGGSQSLPSSSNQDGSGDTMSARMRKKKKHKRGLNHKKFAKSGVAPDRLLAYGLSKTKLKKSKLL